MSAEHDKAKQDYLKGMKYKVLAEKYGVTLNTIKSWKQRYKWDRKGVHTNTEKGAHKKRGAPLGSRNALGNKGGRGGPTGNGNAVKHGFFARIFPDDEETMAIVGEINGKRNNTLGILWENIVIQYTAIARAQKLMFIKDQHDITEHLKRERRGSNPEKEWELQFAWDKHARFLQAQSRAIKTLEGLIARYEQMLLKELDVEEQQLRVDKLRAEIAKIKDPEGDPVEDDGFIEALQAEAIKDIWNGDGDEC